eukprot:TRINITY_DN8801_c0_g1_i1.p1 TRINITY_DN8801_c0_g1~~TRINITY_DN8801_c0_g1_i1.p1  ORF type:complete len:442 (+),score=85.47 TRINITY_DN8801_c0_g1_i1:60-1328(+)
MCIRDRHIPATVKEPELRGLCAMYHDAMKSMVLGIEELIEKYLEVEIQNATESNVHPNLLEIIHKQIGKVIDEGDRSGNVEIQLLAINLYIDISLDLVDVQRAIRLLKRYRKLCELYEMHEPLMKAYYKLGLCYQRLTSYSRAMSAFTKMLFLAWRVENVDAEMKAYDCIGLQYFYLGQVERARYYHEKATRGVCEGRNSALVKLGLSKLEGQSIKNKQQEQSEKVKDFDESSEEEAELPIPSNEGLGRGLQIAEDLRKEARTQRKKEPRFFVSEGQKVIITQKKFQNFIPPTVVSHAFLKRFRTRPLGDMSRGGKVNSYRAETPMIDFRPGKQGDMKERYFYNHLSTNRVIENFLFYSHRSLDKHPSLFSKNMLDKFTLIKIKEKAERFKLELLNIIFVLQQYDGPKLAAIVGTLSKEDLG